MRARTYPSLTATEGLREAFLSRGIEAETACTLDAMSIVAFKPLVMLLPVAAAVGVRDWSKLAPSDRFVGDCWSAGFRSSAYASGCWPGVGVELVTGVGIL